MALRVTVMLDEDIASKLRDKQAKQIKKTQKGYSFSQALNDSLRGK